MPRIDPNQLLKTLGVLLSPRGGIKSSQEVKRIVALMNKFSRKLVSKCIYVQILRATSAELLEQFLDSEGWNLLNFWFSDAIRSQNWPFCTEMIELFVICPISATHLKDNVETNQAPRLINQLRQESSVDARVRELATVVYNKWVTIVSPVKADFEPDTSDDLQQSNVSDDSAASLDADEEEEEEEEDDNDDDSAVDPPWKPQPIGKLKLKLPPSVKNERVESKEEAKSEAASKPSVENGPISLLQSLADEVSESIKKEEEIKPEVVKKEPAASKHSKSGESKKSHSSSSSSSKDRRASKDKSSSSSSRDKNRDKDRDRDKDRSDRKRRSEKDKDHHHHHHHRSDREKERKRFRLDGRVDVAPEEKKHIKDVVRRLKEEEQSKKDKDTLNKISSVGSASLISKMPKIPKKPSSEDKSKKGASFADMLGGLDSKPKTVKTPMNKNKTASLLEGLTKSSSPSSKSKDSPSSSSKPSTSSPSTSHHKREHHHHHRHHQSSSSSRDKDSHRSHHHSSSSSRDKDKKDGSFSSSSSSSSKKESSSSSSSPSSKKYDIDKKPASLIMPERDSKKRMSDAAESPKSKSTSSPHNFAESTSFMDAIFSSMHNEQPRKKKRRLSECGDIIKKGTEKLEEKQQKLEHTDSEEKSEKEEDGKEESTPAPAFSFYRDTLETPDEEEKDVVAGDDKAESEEKPETKAEKVDSSDDDDENVSPNSPNKTSKTSSVASDDAGGKSGEDDMPFEEPEEMPREVKGILVYHRGSGKRNKTIAWRLETELVAVKYFEMDDEERVNVNKIKFENMRSMELKMEKATLKSKGAPGGDMEEPQHQWYKPLPIDVDNRPAFTPGSKSEQKDIQSAREKNVLQALYFNRAMTPSTPSEPEMNSNSGSGPAAAAELAKKEIMIIPLDDIEAGDESEKDYCKEGWPDAKVNQVDQQARMESAFSLPPALSNLLSSMDNIQSIFPAAPAAAPPQLSQEEQNIMAAQTKAMQAMGMLPQIDELVPAFPPPQGTAGPPPASGHGNNAGPPPPHAGLGIPVPPPMHYGGGSGGPGGPPAGPGGPGGPPGGHPAGPPPGFNFGKGPRPPMQHPPPFRPNGPNGPPVHPPHPNGRGGGGGNRGRGDFGYYDNGPPPPGPHGRPRGRGGFHNGRGGGGGFQGGRGFRGGFRGGDRDFNDYNIKPQPCKFFNFGRGFCRDSDNCLFLHEQH